MRALHRLLVGVSVGWWLIGCQAGSSAGTDTDAGACPPTHCSNVFDPVCGVDRKTYTNEGCVCSGAEIAYAGPCRNEAITSCDMDAMCGSGQVCVNDPRVACDGGACPGVCVHAQDGPPCDNTLRCVSTLQLCARTRSVACDGGLCGRCVYATATDCSQGQACAAAELCLASFGCDVDAGCARRCAVP